MFLLRSRPLSMYYQQVDQPRNISSWLCFPARKENKTFNLTFFRSLLCVHWISTHKKCFSDPFLLHRVHPRPLIVKMILFCCTKRIQGKRLRIRVLWRLNRLKLIVFHHHVVCVCEHIYGKQFSFIDFLVIVFFLNTLCSTYTQYIGWD